MSHTDAERVLDLARELAASLKQADTAEALASDRERLHDLSNQINEILLSLRSIQMKARSHPSSP